VAVPWWRWLGASTKTIPRLLLSIVLILCLAVASAMGVEGKPRVLLTGASGYLGQFLVDALISGSDYEVGATYHSCPEGLPEGVARFEVDFASEVSIKDCLAKVCMHAHANTQAHSPRKLPLFRLRLSRFLLVFAHPPAVMPAPSQWKEQDREELPDAFLSCHHCELHGDICMHAEGQLRRRESRRPQHLKQR